MLAVLFAIVLVIVPLVLMTVRCRAHGLDHRRNAFRLLLDIASRLLVRADSAWRWCVAGALRLSLAHRCA